MLDGIIDNDDFSPRRRIDELLLLRRRGIYNDRCIPFVSDGRGREGYGDKRVAYPSRATHWWLDAPVPDRLDRHSSFFTHFFLSNERDF